ncbi:protein phosphatase 2C domain-containing protein [Sphingopyxis sp.]|uniref:PP2C family protein-serine/threonine phosphatase n=1 Tax=Sphingopyxis sp. TaxID=1908224 RepID=UPI001D9AA498|nr:protein phosphatase 2C domain-containing protein [Sphingopyxis sp.]MBW8295715.1 protein phosphatase 2C domain-containing protein [Sphingopyxis sp.]
MNFFRIFGRGAAPFIDGTVAAVESVALTHVGHVRAVNEDRILNLPNAKLWAVADGMGGHQSGDVAAQIAIDALGDLASSGQTLCGDDILRALQSANALIYDRYADAERRSGTTIVAALLVDDRLEIFWAGDSRAYRLRGGTWQQLTRDHSLVQQMVDAGAIPPSAASNHPKANVITRALGVHCEVVIDRLAFPLVTGDIIMLCSDGVSRTLGADRVRVPTLAALAQSLIDRALMRDGSDNASLVLVRS